MQNLGIGKFINKSLHFLIKFYTVPCFKKNANIQGS